MYKAVAELTALLGAVLWHNVQSKGSKHYCLEGHQSVYRLGMGGFCCKKLPFGEDFLWTDLHLCQWLLLEFH